MGSGWRSVCRDEYSVEGKRSGEGGLLEKGVKNWGV